jgi:hypothetical protein
MITFIVWVWLETAYDGNHIRVGEFENCDQGVKAAQAQYPDHVALHCILPEYAPPSN